MSKAASPTSQTQKALRERSKEERRVCGVVYTALKRRNTTNVVWNKHAALPNWAAVSRWQCICGTFVEKCFPAKQIKDRSPSWLNEVETRGDFKRVKMSVVSPGYYYCILLLRMLLTLLLVQHHRPEERGVLPRAIRPRLQQAAPLRPLTASPGNGFETRGWLY